MSPCRMTNNIYGCDIICVLKDHIRCLYQLMTHHIDEYDMQLLTTKCLNTAVTFMYLFLGDDALKYTRYCDVSTVKQRCLDKGCSKISVIQSLTTDVVKKPRKGSKKRDLYYVMLTDGDMIKCVETVDSVKTLESAPLYFPGHVFVIEKNPDHSYVIYQSYIQKYDIEDTIKKNNGTISYTHAQIINRMTGLDRFFRSDTWTLADIAFWKTLTFVDVHEYLGYNKSGIFACYRKVKAQSCKQVLKKLVFKEKKHLEKGLSLGTLEQNVIYGDASKYTTDTSNVNISNKPLTNKEMYDELTILSKKL